MRKYISFLLAFFVADIGLSFGFFGPGSIKLTQVYPPSINLGDISRIAILPIKFDQRDQILNKMSTRLLQSIPEDIEIIERDQLDRILAEQNLAASDLINSDTAPEFGALQGVDALIYGTATVFEVQDDDYTEVVEWTERKKVDGKKKTFSYSANASATKRVGTINVTFKMVQVSTGSVIGQDEYSARSVHKYVSHKESPHNKTLPDRAKIKDDLIDQAIDPFAKYLFPYSVRLEADLDGDCKADECKEAIDLLKADMYDMAEETLNGVLQKALSNKAKRKKEKGKDKTLAAIYYHLGLIQESKGNMEEALAFYKKATIARIKKSAKHIKKAMKRVNTYDTLWQEYNEQS